MTENYVLPVLIVPSKRQHSIQSLRKHLHDASNPTPRPLVRPTASTTSSLRRVFKPSRSNTAEDSFDDDALQRSWHQHGAKARMTLLMNGRTAVSLVLIKPRRSVVLCLGYPGRQTDLKKRNSYQSHLQNVSGHATITTMYFYSLFSSIGFSFLLCITPLSLSKFKYLVYKGYITKYYSSHSLRVLFS